MLSTNSDNLNYRLLGAHCIHGNIDSWIRMGRSILTEVPCLSFCLMLQETLLRI